MKKEITCPYCKKMFIYDDQTEPGGSMLALGIFIGVGIGVFGALMFGI